MTEFEFNDEAVPNMISTFIAGEYRLTVLSSDVSGNSVTVVLYFTLTGEHLFIRGDANRDGMVDIGDVITLFGYLFSFLPIADLYAADVNDDGTVDVADLLAVIGAWGPCP